MSSNVLCVSLLFAVIVAASVSQTAGQEYSWKKLNKQLLRHGENVDDYIRLATKRLEKAKDSCIKDKKLIATLERLNDFKLAVQEPKCNPETLAYIKSFSDEIKDYHAIKSIFRAYLKATADKCQEDNVNSYFEKMGRLPGELSEIFRRPRIFFMELAYYTASKWLGAPVSRGDRILNDSASYYIEWASEASSNQKEIFLALINEDQPLATGLTADIAYDAIEISVVEYPNDFANYVTKNNLGKRIITPGSARELFDRLMTQPCKLYVRELGPAVFGRAEADRDVWQASNLLVEPQNKQLSEYYFAWAQYKGCLRLINYHEDRGKLLVYLSKIAEIQTKLRSTPNQNDTLPTEVDEIPDIEYGDFKTARALDQYEALMDYLEETEAPNRIGKRISSNY